MPASAADNATPELDDDLEPLADETADKARLVVASYATDAEECLMLMEMLGIGPETPADDE